MTQGSPLSKNPLARLPNSIETLKASIPFLRPSEQTLLVQKHCPPSPGSGPGYGVGVDGGVVRAPEWSTTTAPPFITHTTWRVTA
jgi:hypothetical protein